MSNLFVSWSDYHQCIEQLAAQIHRSAWHVDHIACVGRGGFRVGDILARLFKKPYALIIAGANDVQVASAQILRGNVLLVDDLIDSGDLLPRGQQLRAAHPQIEALRTAVLWRKGEQAAQTDYCVRQIEAECWLHQPYEPYELISLESLAARV
jgi:hypoxanthine phosphoribosyltransferase